MDTQRLLEKLQSCTEDKSLVFDLGDRIIAPGYHVTEVKAVAVRSVDCGGRANTWNETVVQLWSPGSATAEGYMKVGKFLSIYQRVVASLPIDPEAVLRFEYGEVGEPAISYLVSTVCVEGDAVRVHLSAPGVACKLNAPEVHDIPVLTSTTSCCTAEKSAVSCCT